MIALLFSTLIIVSSQAQIIRPYQEIMSSVLGGSKISAQPSPSYVPTFLVASATSSPLFPATTAGIFKEYASSPASVINVGTSAVVFKTSLNVSDPTNPFHIVNVGQARVDAGVLSVIGNSIALSSGIVGIAASSLSVIKDTLGLLPAMWGLIEKPLQLDVSLTSFGITLFNDGLKYNTLADILGQEAEFVAMWEAVRGQVLSKSNILGSSYGDIIAQIVKAKSILDPLTQFYKQ